MTMAKIFYEFDILESENGFTVLENGELQHTVGTLKTKLDLDLWLEDHASIRGLSPEYYKLNFLPKPLKSDEIVDRTTQICEKVKSFENLSLNIDSLHIFSKYVVELRKWKSELKSTQYTGENCNAIDNSVIIMDFYIESWEAMIGYITRKYIL